MGYLRRRVRDFFTNWQEYEAPVSRKVYLTLRNRSITAGKLIAGRGGCCGHHGEPGC